MAYIIGVSGGSGSGKTSFVKALADCFNEDELTVLSQDDYYKPLEAQKADKNGVINFDLPKSIHLKQFASDIKQLTNGQVVTRQEYTFNNEAVKPKQLKFKPAKVILVEGLFLFQHKKIKGLLDLSILIQAKLSDKIIRRIKRDRVERNYPLEDVLYRYKNHVMPAYDKYIAPYEHEVDIIINNDKSFEKGLQVVKTFVAHKLENQT